MKTFLNLRKGVNLGGWLSQCNYSADRLNNFILESDFATIAEWGLDHVRIPVDYNVLEDQQDGYDAPGWARIDWAIAMAEKYQLKIILDLHKTAGFSFDAGEKEAGFFDSESYQERFYRLWEEIARHYGHLSSLVVFELLNEVTEPRFIDEWNRISNTAIRRIRVYAPNTYILVGSYHHNCAPAVKDLAAPADDRVIYNFHCYDPFRFTHQRAGWVPELRDSAPVTCEETGATEAFFEERLATAIAHAEKNGTSLYCGEYGVITEVEPAEALKWFQAINAVFEKHSIARTVWSYRQMDFGIADPCWDALRSELLKVL